MFDRILIPTDGSEPAHHAAKKGVELAAEHDATVHVLYVIEPIPLGRLTTGPGAASAEHSDVVDDQRAEGQEAIDEVAAIAAEHDVSVVEATRHGEPDKAIVEYVDDEEIDGIVMGTHGRSGAGRLVVGSVAEKVVRSSPVPVTTIRTEDA